MNIKKIIHREFFITIVLILIIVLFLKNINFFKKMYFFSNTNFDKRFTNKVYNYCADDAIGYIYDITKKFNIRNNPKVFNSDIQPDPSWVFLNTSKPKSDEYLFLLNYVENQKVSFEKKGDFFINKNIVNASGISEIEFLSEDGKYLEINGYVKLYNIKVGTYNFKNFENLLEKDISSKKIDEFRLKSNDYINGKYKINKKNESFGGRGNINLIKVLNNQNSVIKKIKKIRISLIHQVSLDDFEILDSYKNKCFYLKKNG